MIDDPQNHSSTDGAVTRSAPDSSAEMERTPNTLLNALIGGVVGVILSPIPFSTVLGGGVAGYLEGGDATAGAKVGALAGLVAFIPFVAIFAVVLFVVPVVSGPDPGVQLTLWVSLLLIVVIIAFYTVGLSSIGGVLGVYLKENV